MAAPSDIAPTRDWAGEIGATWRRVLEAILATGALLADAKAALPHGQFEALIAADLPFGPRTAQRLMAIAADPRIATHVSLLPPAWRTLYELTRLDDQAFAAALGAGVLRPDMQRADLASYRKAATRTRRATALAEGNRGLPVERFDLILADPPWRFEPYGPGGMDRSADNHYPTLATAEIAGLDIALLAAPDCVLLCWATAPMLPAALEVMAAWGFAYKSQACWIKPKAGTGYWFRNCHELLLLGTRGSPPAPAPAMRWRSAFEAPQEAHSAKPDTAFTMIEAMFPYAAKIELFRRGPARPGWHAWGNQAEAA